MTSMLYIVENVVRELRTANGLSQSDLAGALAVSRQTINAIETGRYLPSLPLALRLARYFSTTVEEMFQVGDDKG
jgi:putative transcriptional regulator